ncbi:MAG: MerR family transcriptional regulator [Deltaproteobacteria bacterium]|nr:MAG: MerR family transcriptional regulator [Deltaproteobacteria bacterium]
MRSYENMTISELSRITDTPASTIRFYLREGMLPSPEHRGKTRAYYGEIHVQRLRKIRKMRDNSGFSIREIKNRLAQAIQEDDWRNADSSTQFDRKEDIINAAIALFRSRGYDRTSLDDIVELAKISKGSFYLHFTDKNDLFIECADKVFLDIDREFDELKNVHDFMQRLRMRAIMFIKRGSHFIAMLHLARGTYTAIPLRHRMKLKNIMQNLINPIIQDLDEGVRQGQLADLDTTILAYMMMGGVEYGIYYLEDKSDEEIEFWVDRTISLALTGIYTDPEKTVPSALQAPK